MWWGVRSLASKANGLLGIGSGFQRRRWFSRERAENVRKINPRVSPTEASSIARHLYHLLKPHSPFSISTAWLLAQESGVSGLNSKTHMKLMLKWMRGRKLLKLRCNHVGSTKKFLLSTLPEDPNAIALQPQTTSGLDPQHANNMLPKTNKSSVKRKNKTP